MQINQKKINLAEIVHRLCIIYKFSRHIYNIFLYLIWDAVVLVLHANSRDRWLFSVGFTPLLFLVGSQTLQVHARVFLNQNVLVGFGEDVCKDVSSMCWLGFLARSRWDGPSNHQHNFAPHSHDDGNTAAVSIWARMRTLDARWVSATCLTS